jgi:hypothetical protein
MMSVRGTIGERLLFGHIVLGINFEDFVTKQTKMKQVKTGRAMLPASPNLRLSLFTMKNGFVEDE